MKSTRFMPASNSWMGKSVTLCGATGELLKYRPQEMCIRDRPSAAPRAKKRSKDKGGTPRCHFGRNSNARGARRAIR